MIPKKIHYCWLSGDPFPEHVLKCMDTWRTVLPDYEWVRWDRTRFDAGSVPFVRDACAARQWAFASDYIRLHALYSEGGFYLDSDVMVLKPFEPLRAASFISSVEHHPEIMAEHRSSRRVKSDGTRRHPHKLVTGMGLQAAIMGSEPGHPLVRGCMEMLSTPAMRRGFGPYGRDIIAPDLYALAAEAHGFRYRDEEQNLLHGARILPSWVLAGGPPQVTDESLAFHCCVGSWRPPPRRTIRQRIAHRLRHLRAR